MAREFLDFLENFLAFWGCKNIEKARRDKNLLIKIKNSNSERIMIKNSGYF
ncbi:MAG: hypothetical protein KH296_11745 [Ruminococcus sp.]|jgi:hypothetical protein|nr:hypothetical protein [Ruminococcus sp.]